MKPTTPTGQKPIEADEEPNGKNTNELRAEWEEMRMTVCANGVVNVINVSHGVAEAKHHTYSVMLDGATAIRCSCLHHRRRGARCKHMIAVENRPLVVSSATATGASYTRPRRAATDGGERNNISRTSEDERSEVRPEEASRNGERRSRERSDSSGSERQ